MFFTKENKKDLIRKIRSRIRILLRWWKVELRKENAIEQCKKYNSIDDKDYAAQYSQLQKMLGSVREKVWIAKTFNCDNGKRYISVIILLETII